MSAWRDLQSPTRPHVFTLDRVRLEFGGNGILRDPTSEQLATMTATPLRRARFVEVEEPKPTPASRRRPVAEAAAAEPASAPAPATREASEPSAAGSSAPEGGHES